MCGKKQAEDKTINGLLAFCRKTIAAKKVLNDKHLKLSREAEDEKTKDHWLKMAKGSASEFDKWTQWESELFGLMNKR
jgi:hypothetical protein